MARYQVKGPDGSLHEFDGPDGATPDQVVAAAQQILGQTANTPSAAERIANDPITKGAQDPTQGMGFLDKFNAGAGKAIADIGRGIGQKLGMVSNQDVTESRRLDAPLMATGAAKAGNIGANIAMLAPASLLPGAATVPGAAVIGGLMGAAQQSASTGEAFLNTGLGAAGGAAGQKLANMAAGSTQVQQAANAQRTAQAAQKTAAAESASKAGYVIPPEDLANPSTITQLLSGVGGKIKTAQIASERNQTVTNDLARQALGLQKGSPLTTDVLNTVRQQAGQAYDAIKNTGTVAADPAYQQALNSIGSKFTSAASAFPGAVKSDIPDLVKALDQPAFSADAAVEMTKILRANADTAMRTGGKQAAVPYKQLSDALEGMLERHLQAVGSPDALQAFREARQLIAKTYSVQKGLNEATGDVSANALAQQLAKGKPLSNELATIAQAAAAFPKATQALKEAPKQISPLDMAFALSRTAGGNLLNLGTLGARPAARSIMLSGPAQRAAIANAKTPQQANALLRLLSRDELTMPAGVAGAGALSGYLSQQ